MPQNNIQIEKAMFDRAISRDSGYSNGANTSKYWSLYKKCIPNLKDKGKEWRGACPFHEEKTPGAFAINSETGQYFCHSCGESGNAVTFARRFGEKYELYYRDFQYQPKDIDISQVEYYHNNFLNNQDVAPRYWDLEFIKLLKIGYDNRWNKLVFPIYNEYGRIINLKQHKGRQTPGSKVSLYPLKFIDLYNNDFIVVCEGEKDCVTLLSKKIQAVTGTGGAINIPKNLSVLNRFLHFYICFDNDETGIAGAEKWAQAIKKLDSPKIVKIADIGRIVREGGDVTDYFNAPFTSRNTFCHDILGRAKSYKPYTDVSDFVRRVMLSENFQNLTMRDQNVFTTLVLRASRYYTKTTKVNGKNIIIGPGEFFTSIKRLKAECASDVTEKQVRSAIDSLQKKQFIKSEDQKAKRGRLISILGWEDDGQPKRQTKSRFKYVKTYPFFREKMDNSIETN